MISPASPSASAPSLPGLGITRRSASGADSDGMGFIRMTLAPFSFAFLMRGTMWMLVTMGFLPQRIISLLLGMSEGSCWPTSPQSEAKADSPAALQSDPEATVAPPKKCQNLVSSDLR